MRVQLSHLDTSLTSLLPEKMGAQPREKVLCTGHQVEGSWGTGGFDQEGVFGTAEGCGLRERLPCRPAAHFHRNLLPAETRTGAHLQVHRFTGPGDGDPSRWPSQNQSRRLLRDK